MKINNVLEFFEKEFDAGNKENAIQLVKLMNDVCNQQNEKKILMLKLQGYKHEEISLKLHFSISKINNYMQSIRAKTMEFGYNK